MSRVRSFPGVLLGSLVALVAFTSGCRVTVETKNRFVEDNVEVTAAADWNGTDAIRINCDGTGVAINGGLDVISDPGTTRVRAVARMLANAFAEDKPLADESIREAKETFKITSEGGTLTVRCSHGGSHGSSNGGESGCEKLTVYIPAGSDAQKLKLDALSGNGAVNLKLSNAFIANLGVNGQGDIDATLPSTLGGNVSIVAENKDDITAHLPDAFAADDIVINADTDKIVNDFPDAKIGQGAGGRGQPGTGLAALKLTSKPIVTTGTIRLTR